MHCFTGTGRHCLPIDYALAVAEKLRSKKDAAKVGEQIMKKQENLDEEIEKLEKEMQELEESESARPVCKKNEVGGLAE